MQPGRVGSGRMGSNRVSPPMNEGRESMAYNRHGPGVKALQSRGARGAGSLPDRVARLTVPRPIGLMVPAAAAWSRQRCRPSLAGKVAMAMPKGVICIAVRRVAVPSPGGFTTGSGMA
jgi:6-phosphogluconate dehydrogenase (decarboxylating)